MILLSQTDRSFIAYLEPDQRIVYADRDGKVRTVQCGRDHEAGWLHLFHHDPGTGIVKAWFGTPTRLQNNIPITDRQPVSRALEALLLQPARTHAALITWELKKHTTRTGAVYGQPVWIPADYALVPIEQEAVPGAV